MTIWKVFCHVIVDLYDVTLLFENAEEDLLYHVLVINLWPLLHLKNHFIIWSDIWRTCIGLLSNIWNLDVIQICFQCLCILILICHIYMHIYTSWRKNENFSFASFRVSASIISWKKQTILAACSQILGTTSFEEYVDRKKPCLDSLIF